MDINVFSPTISFESNSWMKMIRWGCVFFVLACSCVTMLVMSECVFVSIGFGGLTPKMRWWICFSAVVFVFAVICCVLLVLTRWLVGRIQSLQWKGKSAKQKIQSLSIFAQEQIREHIEHNARLRFNKDADPYIELINGNFIETLPNQRGIIVDCKLKEWVLECFAKYPYLVKELCEMDEAYRELDQTFPA